MANRGRKPAHRMVNVCRGALHTAEGKIPPGGEFVCNSYDAKYFEKAGLAKPVPREGGEDADGRD